MLGDVVPSPAAGNSVHRTLSNARNRPSGRWEWLLLPKKGFKVTLACSGVRSKIQGVADSFRGTEGGECPWSLPHSPAPPRVTRQLGEDACLIPATDTPGQKEAGWPLPFDWIDSVADF